jgi:SAM-dependent methyltransferase
MKGGPLGASQIATAYDAVAEEYDGELAGAWWMRHLLWLEYDRLFRAGHHVLDIGAGTGIDTVHLARRGVRVTAVDASPGMIARLSSKVSRGPVAGEVTTHTGDVVEVLASLDGAFDGIVSSFAALNTIDLTALAPLAARLVRPGRPLVGHMLTPRHRATLTTRIGSSIRASGSGEDEVVVIRGHGVTHRLLPRAVAEGIFAPAFVPRRATALRAAMGLASLGRFELLVLDRRRDGVP